MVNAFTCFGGLPEEVLTDNMKTVVTRRESGQPIWNTAFEDFSIDMGFVSKVCSPRRPQSKGKVERLVGYVKDNFLPGRRFEDLNDLNHQAMQWCRERDRKIHGTTGKIPPEELQEYFVTRYSTIHHVVICAVCSHSYNIRHQLVTKPAA